ncbi:hypothetical protein DE146DRAFT_641112 [Phaeosphaeria sp. MPI-PUGE-AT-0046c]|nr:hypothetical protein DE146DRAFT_641112 [Phaeosphaeria sp. MPI-PUGE-AT-0046c]
MHILAALCILTQAWEVKANVEKTIFLGPDALVIPHAHPSLNNLRLNTLSHSQSILAAQLPVRFPSKTAPHGLDSWYLLHQLQPGRRYEVRICWPATQPTDFWLDTFTVQHTFDTPELVTSLAHYSEQLQDPGPQSKEYSHAVQPAVAQSLLFLRVQAAASYYSANRTLMEYPEPVDVDIILDPFLLNILPQSLGPVAVYITAVAIGAWILSGYFYRWLTSTVTGPPPKPHTE